MTEERPETAPDPAAEELARAEREAAEALSAGAFQGGAETQRVRREDILAEAGLGKHSPLVDGATPAPSADAPPSEKPAAEGEKPAEAAPPPAEPSPAPEAAPVAAQAAEPAPSTESAPAVSPPETPSEPRPASEAAAPAEKPAEPTPPVAAASDVPVLPATPAAPAASDPAGTVTEKFDRETAKAEAGVASKPAPAPTPPRPTVPRTEADDRLLAALIFLSRSGEGQSGPPSPFATVGGVSLLRRVAASCELAQVPKVLLCGESDPQQLEKVKQELRDGGWSGTIDVWDGGGPPPVDEKGRLLILDASGVHDPEAVARLARWKGERACVLVASEGDGMRVQVEGNRVREVGTQLVPFDGVTCGAVNVPLPLFPRLSELGALSALVSLAQDGLLGASVEHRTFAREIGSETGLSEARQRLMERAAGGPHDTYLNKIFVRRVARPLTQALLPLGAPPAALDAASLLVGLVGVALLTGGGAPPHAALLMGGAILIIASTIFDCVGFELRSFAIQPGGKRSPVHVLPHGIVTAGALAAFGYGCQLLGVDGGKTNGLFAAGSAAVGTLLLAIAHWQGDDRDQRDPATLGIELLSKRLLNREIGWLLLALVAAHFIIGSVRPPAPDMPVTHDVLDHGLVALAATSVAYTVALALFLALQPRRR